MKAPSAALDAISNFLIERGSPGVVIKKNEVQAFFARPAKSAFLKRDVQHFLRAMRGIYPGVGEEGPHWALLQERDWHNSWRRFFQPQKVGKSLWISPPWVTPPELTQRHVIAIEPGMAFGTGSHPTTRTCLEFLEEVLVSLKPVNPSVLDVGTGSGILAIAVAKLGARRVLAVDNDPIALEVARANIRLNRAQQNVKLSHVALSRLRGSFEVVVANLTAETIVGLAQALREKASRHGYLILSGILKPKAREVSRRFAPKPFELVYQKSQREWTTLLLGRKN
ncbi:MAG: 50S ribosomal protein L11 methyltransferase [Deltaproteobacteria bacterium]|nr:50S ribosomal protein L11 methyltransferase [Deltaproteobacteria bacterium]